MTRIGLLECDHVDERLASIAGDYRDMFGRLLSPHGLDLTPVDARNGTLPSGPTDFEGYVITGSRLSAYDDEPWIQELSAFVRDVAGAEVPVIGICFGHQLLAHALGGEVRKATSGWGVGPHEVAGTDGANWVLQFMHQDQVIRVPDNGRVVGASDHCPVAMMQVGDRVLGIQAHPEFGAAYVDALMATRIERIGAERVEAARQALTTPTDHEAVAASMAAFLRG